MNNNKIRDLRAFVKYSALLTNYSVITHLLALSLALSRYKNGGTGSLD